MIIPRASGETAAVAMSGGVDSSVTASLLAEAGYTVFGLTMRLSRDEGAEKTIEDARLVADHLGMPHHVVDCRERFRERVLRPCWEEYARGRTPNPCVLCNPRVKFGMLLEHARRLGATRLATGHHARLREADDGDAPSLLRGRDPAKDQSYFLSRLTVEQRRAAMFPIGEMTKIEVRSAARERALPSAEAAESQDTCVVSGSGSRQREGLFAETLRGTVGAKAEGGSFVDPRGRAIGTHEGVHLFTVGQRRGLGLSLGRRAYVVSIDGARREVTVSTDPADLLAGGLVATDVSWIVRPPPRGEPFECAVQIRYRHQPIGACLFWDDDRSVQVHFSEAVSAVTPGQYAVFYDDDVLLGSGSIERALPLSVDP